MLTFASKTWDVLKIIKYHSPFQHWLVYKHLFNNMLGWGGCLRYSEQTWSLLMHMSNTHSYTHLPWKHVFVTLFKKLDNCIKLLLSHHSLVTRGLRFRICRFNSVVDPLHSWACSNSEFQKQALVALQTNMQDYCSNPYRGQNEDSRRSKICGAMVSVPA